MTKKYYHICLQFDAELMNLIKICLPLMPSNSILSDCEIILSFVADTYHGALHSYANGSLTSLARNTRGQFETLMDSQIVKNGPVADKIYEFKIYALVETRKMKMINGGTPSQDEIDAANHFANPADNNKPYKHWSKINSVEARARYLGGRFNTTYDTFYRIASLAVHGSTSFAIFYQNRETHSKMSDDCMALSTDMAYESIQNLLTASTVSDAALISSLQRLEVLKKQVII